jgi:hypothetical protein
MALQSWNNFWFDPKSIYGGTQYQNANQFGRSPAGTSYYNKTPSIYFNRMTLPYAGGSDPFSQFVQSRQSMFQQGYASALGSNPNLTVQQYAQQIGLNQNALHQQFMQQSPNQRGVNYSDYSGRSRWVMG